MKLNTHILDTAEQLFNCYGYTAVGIDLIRDEAEVSKTTIYRYFGDKSGVIAAVLERRHKRFETALQEVSDLAQGMEAKILAILEWHFKWFNQSDFQGCMFMHALSEFKTKDGKITDVTKQHKRWIKELIFNSLDESVTDRVHAMNIIMTILEGLIVRAEFSDLTDDINDYSLLILGILRKT